MTEYRFVCVDAQARWQDVRYAMLSGDSEAKRFGCDLLREFVAVIVYEGDRKLAVLAEITGNRASA